MLRPVPGFRYKLASVGLGVDDVAQHGVLEERLHPASYIIEEQAATVQSAVNAIAMELTKRDPSKNHFQGIHGELLRRFKVRRILSARSSTRPCSRFLTNGTWP